MILDERRVDLRAAALFSSQSRRYGLWTAFSKRWLKSQSRSRVRAERGNSHLARRARAPRRQIVSAILVVGFLWWSISNVIASANQRGLSLGFQFLDQAAGFPIGETAIPYDPSRSFAYAFLIGVLNTLKVSIVGILLATIVGVVVSLARLSSNWLVSRLALAYIEIHRNIPLLVLLFMRYSGSFSNYHG
jgi:general L-amino acid transport system permease protein